MLVDGGSSSDTSAKVPFAKKKIKSNIIFDTLPRILAGMKKRTNKKAKYLTFIHVPIIRRQCWKDKHKFRW